MNADDKALIRSLAAQLAIVVMMKAGKPARWRELANACDQVAARLRERADAADVIRP